jgi:hypothetical protein
MHKTIPNIYLENYTVYLLVYLKHYLPVIPAANFRASIIAIASGVDIGLIYCPPELPGSLLKAYKRLLLKSLCDAELFDIAILFDKLLA